MSRKAVFIIFVGTNGTGKSTQMKKCLKINDRNLIIPANSLDAAFESVKELPSKEIDVHIKSLGAKPKRVRVYPQLNRFKGTRKAFLYENEDIYGIAERFDVDANRCFLRGGLFLDDFKNYIKTRGPLPSVVRSIFSDRRHREIDVFMAAHSFQYINPELFAYEPILYIFRTTQPVTSQIKHKISNTDELEATIRRVNEKSETNPYYFEKFIPI